MASLVVADIVPRPVLLSLSDDPDAAFPHQHHPRRPSRLSSDFILKGDHVRPVHSLAPARNHLSSTRVHTKPKHSFQPTQVQPTQVQPPQSDSAALNSSSDDDDDDDDTFPSCAAILAGPDLAPPSFVNMPVRPAQTYPVVDMAVLDSFPPDLSSSRSSKSSSSFRSSILSETLSPENVTHFEDISLDEKRDSYDFHAAKDARSRITTRPLHSTAGSTRRLPLTVDNVRSIHIPQPPPAMPGRPALDERSPNMPMRSRPGSRSGANPCTPPSPDHHADSRSPSPSKGLIDREPQQRSAVPIQASAPHTFLSAPPNRRKTWAPGRKTVKQLEDEYHDSDEEVPDDAVIWNVPISPLEPFTAASREPSPRRKPSRTSPKSDGRQQPSLCKYPSAPNTVILASRSSTHLGLPRSATTGSFSSDSVTDLYSMRERHKSWQADLSAEARHVALALEAHQARTSSDSRTRSSQGSPPNSALFRSQSNPPHLSLPPVQKPDAMIDPLPISKEKEAVLARTRPSWLPPKCRKEERKHLKEWERMMAHSAVADRRRAAKQLDEMESSRTGKESLNRAWEDHVLPRWSTAIRERRTRDLWWSGIPPKVRGKVWSRAIGNDLRLTPATFERALERAGGQEERLVKDISESAATAFPDTGLFKAGSPLHTSLVDILKAYAAYRPELGFQHVTVRIAALLLLNMSAADAFIALVNLLNRPLPVACMTRDRQGMDKWISLCLSMIAVKLPKLHDHLLAKVAPDDQRSSSPERSNSTASTTSVDPVDSPDTDCSRTPSTSTSTSTRPTTTSRTGTASIRGEELVRPMLESLCTRQLGLETLSRVWDIYVFEGDKALVRTMVGVLARWEGSLYGLNGEELVAALGGAGRGEGGEEGTLLGGVGGVEELVRAIRDGGRVERRTS